MNQYWYSGESKATKHVPNPQGVLQILLATRGKRHVVKPLRGLGEMRRRRNPGWAARPWALLCNRFAVAAEEKKGPGLMFNLPERPDG